MFVVRLIVEQAMPAPSHWECWLIRLVESVILEGVDVWLVHCNAHL